MNNPDYVIRFIDGEVRAYDSRNARLDLPKAIALAWVEEEGVNFIDLMPLPSIPLYKP